MDEFTVAEKYERLVEQRRAAVKKWQKSNKEKVDYYKKQYLAKNKEKSIKSSQNYIHNNKDKYKEYQLLYRQSKLLRQLPFYNEPFTALQ